MCYYHQHACLLVCLSLLPTCLSVKLGKVGAWQERKGGVLEEEGLIPQCTL